jgi:transglutaminase-like putative cysteine protease
MRAWILILVLAIVPAVIASQEAADIFAGEQVDVEVSVSSDLKLVPKDTGDMSVEYVEADLYFYPKADTAQQIISIDTEPDADRFTNYLRYRWEPPTSNKFRYKATSIVSVRNFFPRVLNKIDFPLNELPEEVREYTKPSKHIDSNNPAIVNAANKLAQGNDDLFVVVSEMAIWTKNNIAYNLTSLTADVTQTASWVLENKYGVCDELTSLYIAMLRAVGIPARFVTGVSYTSSPLFPMEWGSHGWAEVFFPGVGWIPFDPTFGEFGWVDPGHVKMISGLDSEEPGVRFEWQGNAKLEFTPQKIDARIKSVTGRIAPVVELSVKPIYDEVGFGSHNIAQATVENLQPYYATTEIRLARVDEMQVIEPLARQVILKPREKKTIFWRVQVEPGLNENYVYTVPLGVYTIMNDTAQAKFTAKAQAPRHSRADATKVMNTLSEDEGQVVSHNLELSCASDKKEIYSDEKANVNCTLRNLGTTPLKSVSVCIEDKQCSALDIGIGQARQVSFVQGFTIPGPATLFVRARNTELSKNTPVSLQMLDLPDLNITEISYPAAIKYGDKFTLLFVLTPSSYSAPKNLELKVRLPTVTKNYEVAELSDALPFAVELDSNDLRLGTTDIRIEVAYKDDRGKARKTSATAPITLTDVPFFSKIWLWFRGWFV